MRVSTESIIRILIQPWDLKLIFCAITLSINMVTDYCRRIVYLPLQITAVIIGVVVRISLDGEVTVEWGLGLALGFCVLMIAILSEDAIGTGDGLAFIGSGAFLGGWNNLILLTVSLLMAGLYGMGLLIFRKGTRKTTMPYLCFVFPAFLMLLYTGGFRI